MFNDLVISSVERKRTNKSWTMILSALIQAGIVALLVIVPLLVTEALPKGMSATMLIAPPPPPPPPPPPVPHVVVHHVPLIQSGKLVTPTVVPKQIKIIEQKAEPDVGPSTGVIGGMAGGEPGGVLGGIIGGSGPAPPPPPKKQILRVGGAVEQANLVHKVVPEYPIIARTAHVQGTVVFHAIIAKDGTIQQLQYISGPQMLVAAARNAILQWRYRPTYLDGEPVQVDTEIAFEFTFGD